MSVRTVASLEFPRTLRPPTILSADVEIDLELSLLAFQSQVLALVEDHAVPLLERLRFLGIVTSNIDELYMVRMAELRRAAIDEAGHATGCGLGRTAGYGLPELDG